MVNTIVKPTKANTLTILQLPVGTIFEYTDGETAYIKTDDNAVVNLRTGSIYTSASKGPVHILPWVRLESPIQKSC